MYFALHGFAGSPAHWEALLAPLESACLAPTIAGHLETPPPSSFEAEVERLLALVPTSERPILLGYSLGARLGLGLLARAPQRFSGAVLVAPHPGLKSAPERAERQAADEIWVRRLREEDRESFARAWRKQAIFASQDRLPPDVQAAQLKSTQAHDAEGLASAMHALSLGRMPSYWDTVAQLTLPLLFVAGSLDQKFSELMRKAHALAANSKLLEIPDVGHNPLLEAPDALLNALTSFTDAVHSHSLVGDS